VLPRRSTSLWSAPPCCGTGRTRINAARVSHCRGPELVGQPGAARWQRTVVSQHLRRGCRLASGARTGIRCGQPAVAIIKHANPCGAAVADDLVTAYERALECDVQSPSVVWCHWRRRDRGSGRGHRRRPQADVIIASSYEPAALEKLTSRRKATRLLAGPAPERATRQLRSLGRVCWCRTLMTSCHRATSGKWSPRGRQPRTNGVTWSWPGGCAGGQRQTPSHCQRWAGGWRRSWPTVSRRGGGDRGDQGGRAAKAGGVQRRLLPFPDGLSCWPMPA